MNRPWWLCGLLTGLVISMASAKTGVVQTKDGARLEGDIKEDVDKVTVSTRSGVVTAVARTNIVSVEYVGSFDEQFKRKLAALGPKDAKGRVALGKWAFENGQYIVARETLDDALKIDPGNAEAHSLLNTVRGQIRLMRAGSAVSEEPAATAATTAAPAKPAAAAGTALKDVLTPAEVNAVWQMELQRELDAKITVRFEKDVQRRYALSKNKEVAEFMAKPVGVQAAEIIASGEAKYRQDVKILTPPASVKEFRVSIWPLVAAGCATSRCHGSTAGKGLVLVSPAENDAAITTNFYILAQYSKMVEVSKKGGSSEAGRYMIDRTAAGRSLLIQYGLKTNLAETPHPPVEGFAPIFGSDDDRRMKTFADWMGKTLNPIRPEYGIEYPHPVKAAEPAPAPAAAPAPAPAAEAAPAVPPATAPAQ